MATGLRGEAAKACPTSPSARAISAVAESVILSRYPTCSLPNHSFCLDGPRIERQRALEQADRLAHIFARVFGFALAARPRRMYSSASG